MIIFSATGSLMEDFKRSITRIIEGVKLPSPMLAYKIEVILLEDLRLDDTQARE